MIELLYIFDIDEFVDKSEVVVILLPTMLDEVTLVEYKLPELTCVVANKLDVVILV